MDHKTTVIEEDLCLITVDGGVKRAASPEAHAYGSAHFTTHNWEERVEWETLPAAQTAPEAEYDALIAALEFCREVFAHREVFPRLRIQMDSLLVVQQARGAWVVRADNLKPRCARVLELMGLFPEVVFGWISRDQMKEILGH